MEEYETQFLTPRSDVSEAFIKALDAVILHENKKQPDRKYLGGSSVGDTCEKRVALNYFSTTRKEFDARTYRIFQAGHDGEERFASYMHKIFDIRTHNDDGSQFGFSLYKDRYKGHMDGVILGLRKDIPKELQPIIKSLGLDKLKFPIHWEHKTANDSRFKEFKKNGVYSTHAIYFGQTQVYRKNIKPRIDGVEYTLEGVDTLMTIEGKNNSDIYAEIIPFDDYYAQTLNNRAYRIVNASNADGFKKISEKREFMACRMCSYADKCHGPKLIESIFAKK